MQRGKVSLSRSFRSLLFSFREEQTPLFLNHAFARVTPAIFVIFVVFGGLKSEPLFSVGRMQIRHFRRFRQNGRFGRGQIRHSLRGSLLKGGYNNSLHVPLAVPTPAPTPPP